MHLKILSSLVLCASLLACSKPPEEKAFDTSVQDKREAILKINFLLNEDESTKGTYLDDNAILHGEATDINTNTSKTFQFDIRKSKSETNAIVWVVFNCDGACVENITGENESKFAIMFSKNPDGQRRTTQALELIGKLKGYL